MIASESEHWNSFCSLLVTIGESASIRSLLIAVLSVLVSLPLAGWVSQQKPKWRRLAFLAAIAPFFAPELIVGYCYSSGVFSLVHRPGMNVAFYGLVLLLKTAPVAMLVVLSSPAGPLSRTALHCHRLLPHRNRSWRAVAGFWIRGPLHQRLPVFAVSFLIAFQEFEIASLMSIPSWTVEIFDAQAKAIRPLVTARFLLIPLVTICVAVLPAVIILTRETRQAALRSEGVSSRFSVFGGGLVFIANLLLWVIPVWTIGAGGLRYSGALLRNTVVLKGFAREIGSALGFAFCGALVAVFAALLLLGRLHTSRGVLRQTMIIVFLLPGLAGSLAVSLVVFVAIQQAPVVWLRSTPIPAVVGIAVFLLPRAALMLLLFRSTRRGMSAGSADLLSRSGDIAQADSGFRLRWQLDDRAIFWTFAAVFFWGYFNLTTASLLVPLSIVPLPAQLYNLMHYGRIMSLSTQTLLSVVVPLSLICLAAWSLPRIERLMSGRDDSSRSQLSQQKRKME